MLTATTPATVAHKDQANVFTEPQRITADTADSSVWLSLFRTPSYRFTVTDGGAVTALSFAGDGSGLFNLPAGQLVGSVPPASLPATLAHTNINNDWTAGQSFIGNLDVFSFAHFYSNVQIDNNLTVQSPGVISGDGSGLTNLPIPPLPGNIAYKDQANTFTTGNQLIQTGAAGNTGLMVRAAAGQTALLQQWQTSTGAVRTAIGPAGMIRWFDSGGTSLLGQLLADDGTGSVGYRPAGPGFVGWYFEGNPGQTADLTQWRNSAGTPLARVDAAGKFVGDGSLLTNLPGGGAVSSVFGRTGAVVAAANDYTASQVTNAAATNAANTFTVSPQTVVGTIIARQPGGVAGTDEAQLSHDGTRTLLASKDGPIRLDPPAAAGTLLEVYAGGNDYFQVNTNPGANIRVRNGLVNLADNILLANTLGIRLGSDLQMGFSNNTTSGSLDAALARAAANVLRVTNGTATGTGSLSLGGTTGLTITNPSSTQLRDQALMLGTWADSTDATRKGRVFFSVFDTAAREFLRAESDGSRGIAAMGGGAALANTSLAVYAPAADRKPLVLKGAFSQTANLQEWQDSTAAVLARVDAAGKFVGDGSLLTNLPPSPPAANVALKDAANTFTTGTQLIQTGTAGTVGLAVRATAGQSANLQEWRDSAGAVLASLSANGRTLTMPVQFAIGNGSVANGSQALALGLNNSAGGANSVSIGAIANASQSGAVAIGVSASATATDTVALGNSATANQARSFALGAGVTLAPDELAYGSIGGLGATAHLRLTGHSDVQPRSLFRLTTAWVSSTDASFKGRFSLHVCDAGAPSLGREALRGESDGSRALVAFGGAVQAGLPVAFRDPVLPGGPTWNLGVGTPLAVGTDVAPLVIATFAGTAVKCWLACKTAPAGADLVIDIKKSGTSLWAATPANRPRIAAGAATGSQASFDTTAFAAGDLFTIDVVQVGSTTPGQDLTVKLSTLVGNV
jgi:Head domain of trimeric autotransporter adhesin